MAGKAEDTKLNDATQVVALGYSLVAGISDNAQITFHGAIADDDPDSVANAKIDRIMRIVNRQRALGEVSAIEKEKRELQDRLDMAKDDFANSETNFQKAQADLQVQAQALQARLAEANVALKTAKDEAESQHAASGRGGSYAPRGHVKTNIDRANSGIDNIKKNLDAVLGAAVANENERTVTLSNWDTNKVKIQTRIEMLNERLAEIEKLKD